MEEKVIAKIKAEREAAKQHEQAEKLKEFQTKSSKNNPVFANIGGNILQPTTAATTATTTNSLNTNTENNPFNYKDFENNTDTPFEAVELQTIDNMQALKSVLQPDVKTDFVRSCQPQATSAFNTIPTSISGMPLKELTNQSDSSVASQRIKTTFPISGSLTQVTKPCLPVYHDDPTYCQVGQSIPQNTNPFVTPKQRPVSTGIVSASPQLNTVSYTTGNTSTHGKVSMPGAMRVLPATPARLPTPRPTSASNEEIITPFQSHFESPTVSSTQKRPIPKPRSKLPPLRNDSETVSTSESLYDVPPPPLPPKKIVLQKSLECPKTTDAKVINHNSM